MAGAFYTLENMAFDIDLVGKIGSMALIDRESNNINYNIIARLSHELKPGMVWVTSGAVEIGKLDYYDRFGKYLDDNSEDAKTDYAAQGQPILMNAYRQFINSKYAVRQLLVEHQHFNNEEKRKHLYDFIMRCPAQNAIPIINYNDAVSYEENRKWEINNLKNKKEKVIECIDNDETASQIACLVKCKTLLILTVSNGIYSNPEDSSSLIETISGNNVDELLENITKMQEHCSGASRKGANGAKAKLEYIKEPVKNGTTVYIASSKYLISDILSGNAPCTRIGL